MPPVVSIVTVTLNDRAGLARTLASVGRQTFVDRESIVVDGGSTDGSVEVIREQAAAGVVTDWVSEQDSGIYEAMNKGILRSKGTYLLFMNGGDEFAADDALERFLCAAPPVEDLLYSDAIWERADGSRDRWRTPRRPDLAFLMRSSLPHQSTLIRRALLDRIGLYDTSLRIVGDYELTLRAVLGHGATTRRVPVPLSVYRLGGVSTRPQNAERVAAERRRAVEQAVPAALRAEWDAQVAAEQASLGHAVRGALRPLARRARALSRRLRGKPDGP